MMQLEDIQTKEYWTVYFEETTGALFIRNDGKKEIAIVNTDMTLAEATDNALLMAAAPKLFEACKAALIYMKRPRLTDYALVISVLEKAMKKSYGLDI